ncbi:MAG: GNAT family N-acetyltransferase [Bacillota bacterium]
MSVEIVEISIGEVDVIKPLWEKLYELQRRNSTYFLECYGELTFEERMKRLYDKVGKGLVRIDAVRDNNHVDRYVGYCISSVTGVEGEVDSIFLEEEYRGIGIGDMLMENALRWIDTNNAKSIKISVIYGNDAVLPFYEKHGFYPRSYVLYRRD